MGFLVFVGMGLCDELDLSLRSIDILKSVDRIYAELYTSYIPHLSVERLEKLLGKKVEVLSRSDLEEKARETILAEAKKRSVALLVPGDPMLATTHVALRIEAEEMGIRTEVVHAASIFSAAPSATGLQPYKFGRSVTITFPEGGKLSNTPYEVLEENSKRGLHTLFLLDIKAEAGKYMTIRDAVHILLQLESLNGRGVVGESTLGVGLARIGSPDGVIKAGALRDLATYPFPNPPYALVIPGALHFMERRALELFAGLGE